MWLAPFDANVGRVAFGHCHRVLHAEWEIVERCGLCTLWSLCGVKVRWEMKAVRRRDLSSERLWKAGRV